MDRNNFWLADIAGNFPPPVSFKCKTNINSIFNFQNITAIWLYLEDEYLVSGPILSFIAHSDCHYQHQSLVLEDPTDPVQIVCG